MTNNFLIKSATEVQSYTNQNFNGYTMYNMKTSTAYTDNARNHKMAYGVEAIKKEIHITGKRELIEGKARIDIPKAFHDKMIDYTVHLTKYSKGDIWVGEENNTHCVICGDSDFKFSYSIIINIEN
jgi:hypothetical protein